MPYLRFDWRCFGGYKEFRIWVPGVCMFSLIVNVLRNFVADFEFLV